MTRAPAIPRYIHCIVFLIVSASCSHPREGTPVTVVDLVRDFPHAEKRPAEGFAISAQQIGGVTRRAIVVPVPSRIIWPLVLPRGGAFRAFVAAGSRSDRGPATPIRLRVGVSDERIYDALGDVVLAPGTHRWTEFGADLSAYAGWRWSLFYQPDRITWRLVLAADATGASPALAVWGAPEIVTDTRSAREYATRRRRLTGR